MGKKKRPDVGRSLLLASKLFKRSFVMIWIINFLLYLSYMMINPSLPIYFQSIGVNGALAGICVSMFMLGSILVRPIAGSILDRFGRRTVFFVSTLLLAAIIFSYSFIAASIVMLLVLRVIHGFDWGFASTSTNTLATDTIPRHIVGKGIAIFSISMSFATAGAPTLAVNLMDRIGFSGMMRVSAAFVVVALVIAFFYPFHEHKNQPLRPVSPHRHHFNKDALFERSALLPAVIICCVSMTMTAVITYVPAYARSIGLGNAGGFFLFYAIGLISVRLIIGSLVDHFGVTVATLPTFICLILALILLAHSTTIMLLFVSGFLYGAGYGGAQSTLQSLAVMNASSDHFGAANGTFFIGFDLGYGLGALLAGILSDLIGYADTYLALTLFILAAAVLVLKFHPHKNVLNH